MTTRDIIDRALQIADLENSSFISYNEFSSLLSEQWQNIYQKSIDHGDLYWLKECPITSNKMCLPNDFYQLYSVEDSYGNQLLRKTKSEYDKATNRYEIVNNILVTHNVNKDLKLRYYPKPFQMLLKSEILEAQVDNIIDASSKYYLYGESEDFEVATINDLQVEYTSALSFEKAYIDNKVVVLMTGKEATIINIKSTMQESKTIDFVLKSNGVLYYALDGFIYRAFDSALIAQLDDKYDTLNTTYGTFKDDLFMFLSGTTIDFVKDGYVLNTLEGIDTSFLPQVYKDDFFYKTIHGTFRNDNLIWDAEYSTICLIKQDDKTGYGIASEDYILSCFEDTEIKYPNNMFYTLLSYYLAVQFKIKQNADITGLAVSVDQAENTFFATLSNDNDMPIRITNAYARNIGFYQ